MSIQFAKRFIGQALSIVFLVSAVIFWGLLTLLFSAAAYGQFSSGAGAGSHWSGVSMALFFAGLMLGILYYSVKCLIIENTEKYAIADKSGSILKEPLTVIDARDTWNKYWDQGVDVSIVESGVKGIGGWSSLLYIIKF